MFLPDGNEDRVEIDRAAGLYDEQLAPKQPGFIAYEIAFLKRITSRQITGKVVLVND